MNKNKKSLIKFKNSQERIVVLLLKIAKLSLNKCINLLVFNIFSTLLL